MCQLEVAALHIGCPATGLCIVTGQGLRSGGNHGNEYEGQIAALRLIDKNGIDAVLADLRARGQA